MAREVKISGTVYRFQELFGWDAVEVLEDLVRVCGPFLPLLEAVGETKETERTAAIVRAIPSVLAGHDAQRFRGLLDKLFAGCTTGGQPIVVGVKPQSLDEVFQVAAFCLEGQFGPFFEGDGVRKLLGLMTGAKSV